MNYGYVTHVRPLSRANPTLCGAYSKLREGKDFNNDMDIVNYIKKVLQIREDLKLRR